MADEYRITTTAIESLLEVAANARLTSVGLESLTVNDTDTDVRISFVGLEVMYPPSAVLGNEARVTGIGIEVLRSIADAITSATMEFADFQHGETFPIATVPAKFVVKDVERNPYPATLPSTPSLAIPQLQEQQRILRAQHNFAQAGDTTFDFGLLLKATPKKLYTLGSVGRFYHESYGVILARYVKFASMVTTTHQGFVCGRLEDGNDSVDWVVTNDFTKSNEYLAAGVCFCKDIPTAGEYGWLVTYGANPAFMRPASAELPLQNDSYTWTGTGLVGLNARGVVIGRRWGKPTIGAIQPGTILIDLEKLSREDLVSLIQDTMQSVTDRVTALESWKTQASSTLLTNTNSITSLTASIATLTQRIQVEEQTRVRDVNRLRELIPSSDWNSAITSAMNVVRAEFATADDSVRAIAVDAQTIATAAMTAIGALNIVSITSQLANLTTQIVGLSATVIKADLTGLTAGQFLRATSVTNPDGNTELVFQPRTLDSTDISDWAEAIDDRIGAFVTSGIGINVSYNDAGNSMTIAAKGHTSRSESSTSYIGVLADAEYYLRFTNASAITFTVPPFADVAYPVDTVISFEQAGDGQVTLTPGSGVTINSAAGLKTRAKYSVAQVKKVDTNTWTAIGDLTT